MPKKAKTKRPKKQPKKGPMSRNEMEQVMRGIQRAMEGKKFAGIGETDAFLSSLAGKPVDDIFEDAAELTPREQAQELAFDAMEAETDAQARRLAKRALNLDPDCVDALVVMTEVDARGPRDLVQGLAKAVAAGERSLGEKFFRENKGDFWGLLETRPYMRAKEQLAGLLRNLGMEGEAIRHYEEMLALNPTDNQGVRYSLVGCYLSAGKLEAARGLLRKYREEGMAAYNWGLVLERFLSGRLQEASAALKSARDWNPFVELYLTEKRDVPQELPESYALGSEEEAVILMVEQSAAWANHPEAVRWLAAELEREPMSKRAH